MGFNEKELEDLRKKMSPEQVKQMAEIVGAEVKRRENMKSHNNSNHDQKAEMYAEIEERVNQLRAQKALNKERNNRNKGFSLSNIKMNLPRVSLPKFNLNQSTKNLTLLIAVVIFASAKIYFLSTEEDTGKTVDISNNSQVNQNTKISLVDDKNNNANQVPGLQATARARLESSGFASNSGEQQLLNELDARRTELAKKSQRLDEKEAEIKNQSQALAEKMAELKTLTSKIQQVRIEKDNQYEARLEQLAQVYGSIAPNEAAPLVAKLDDETALALLKRMPSKRMGQILSQMDSQRAVDLTRELTSKDKLDEIPAK